MQKDAERWEKMAIDGRYIGEYGFSCVANTHVLLNRRFPYLGGRGHKLDLQNLFLESKVL